MKWLVFTSVDRAIRGKLSSALRPWRLLRKDASPRIRTPEDSWSGGRLFCLDHGVIFSDGLDAEEKQGRSPDPYGVFSRMFGRERQLDSFLLTGIPHIKLPGGKHSVILAEGHGSLNQEHRQTHPRFAPHKCWLASHGI